MSQDFSVILPSDFDIVDPEDPMRATPGGGPHPDYLLESPMSDGTIEEDFEAALARDGYHIQRC